ncbi:MAG TPA: porin family protein [Flavipsychrobacter sp.]|nr:porin family protein [Flavipsychrobacter sp.]
MKKVYVVAVAAGMMLAGSATAQKMKLGVEGGLNINNLMDHYRTDRNKNSTKYGFHAGVVGEFGLSNHFSIAPGLRYSMKGGEFDWEYNTSVDGRTTVVEQEDKLTFHYIELPVNLIYKTGTEGSGRFMIGGGPYLAYLANAQNKWQTKTLWLENGQPTGNNDRGAQEIGVGDDEGDIVRTLDYGAQAFVGYQLPMGAFVKVGSQVGFANTVPKGSSGMLPNPQVTPENDGFRQKNYNFFVTLGYMFGK